MGRHPGQADEHLVLESSGGRPGLAPPALPDLEEGCPDRNRTAQKVLQIVARVELDEEVLRRIATDGERDRDRGAAATDQGHKRQRRERASSARLDPVLRAVAVEVALPEGAVCLDVASVEAVEAEPHTRAGSTGRRGLGGARLRQRRRLWTRVKPSFSIGVAAATPHLGNLGTTS
ncbi:unnamed protein product [Miscanthus lutarioriparius]|uniref:Uncharacterized protein n=1 Tax=Miscanthus lutarioriparius TaxID=422564 RepID=A0A811R965_9POAL|nr:unnamed protein product [Miscanthus lutarioriparius]